MRPRNKIRLGELLVDNSIISQQQLDSALQEQQGSGRKLGRVLIDNGYIEEASLREFLSRQLKIPSVDVRQYEFDSAIVRRLPEMLARRFRAVALSQSKDGLVVGMADPTDIFAYDEIARVLGGFFLPAVVSETDLLRAFDTIYRRTGEIVSYAEALNEELSERDVDLGDLPLSEDLTDAPVVRLVQSLFEDAVQIGASDVHVEPGENSLRIRLRVDGLLQEQVVQERRIAAAMVLRLKLMAGLDISEKRLPQDGRFSIDVHDKTIDVRIATMPLQSGEGVVMRLLDQTTALMDLHHLGMDAEGLRVLDRALSRNQGMVLFTGPTGSGKTTSIYAALAKLNRAQTKIISVEDPVEYQLERVNQVQVHPEIGLSFARVLRGVLRLDPDVLFIGEMRDEETVEIGMRAAMTGHLVLSTLHTNDAISTVTRLCDMKAEGFALAATLNLVVSQRLIRKVCTNCAQPVPLSTYQRSWLRGRLSGDLTNVQGLVEARGCTQCQGVGYQGRVGVHEVLSIDEGLRAALASGSLAEFRALAGQQLAGQTLTEAAIGLAVRGVTTFGEVLRVLGDDSSPVSAEDWKDDVYEPLVETA